MALGNVDGVYGFKEDYDHVLGEEFVFGEVLQEFGEEVGRVLL